MASSNPRYHQLQNEDDLSPRDAEEQPVESNTTTIAANPSDELPPPYDNDQSISPVPTNEDFAESPPLYGDVVFKLPTYDESENLENEETDVQTHQNPIYHFLMSGSRVSQEELTEEKIGTDVGFILCFLITFIFNGIGFIVAYCSTNTVSSHYGAISGFGLSLVKWAFVAKHSHYSKDYFEGNEWVVYVFILLGWLIFLRGMYAYVQLKRYVYSRFGGIHRDIVE